jgi:serine/threonine-protein kinase
MLQPGQVIGGLYRLERAIGHGAFATVWAATNTQSDESVAVKILADAPARRPTVVARFLKEAKICATPIHPTMITVKDLGQTDDGIPYLVMELLTGHTLDQVLRAKGSLPWTMSVEVMQHVLAGLAAAHHRDIIHRDIKPSNIFLVETICTGPPVRVLDLGLARDLADDKRLTRTGQVVGTANYLPPETLLDEQPKGGTKAGDVFAVGMVLFVSVTGRFPFLTTGKAATPAGEVFARASFYKSRAALPGLREFDDTLPTQLDQVVRRAMNVDPKQRYADAPEMLADLETAMGEILPTATHEDFSHNLSKTCVGLPSYLGDADLIQSGEAEVIEPMIGIDVGGPPAMTSPSLAKTSVAYPIQVVGASPGPPELAPQDFPVASSSPRPPAPSRSSKPGRSSRASAPGGSRPSWIRRSPVGLSLLGIAVGTLVGAVILGGIVAWHLAVRSQRVIATQPVSRESTKTAVTLPQHLVEMELTGVPDGARVRLDDRPIEGAVIRGVAGSSAVLAVESPSFEPLRLELTFVEGRSFDVAARLQPLQPDSIEVEEQLVDLPSLTGGTTTRPMPRRRAPVRTPSAAQPTASPASAHPGKAPAGATEVADPWGE